MKTKSAKAARLLLLPLMLSGCAASVSTLPLEAGPAVAAESASGGPPVLRTVCIRSVQDDRRFDEEGRSPVQAAPTLPSSGSVDESRCIGRKLDGFGRLMGGFVLPEGVTAASLVQEALVRSFAGKGVRVVSVEEASSGTAMLDVRLSRFWTWQENGRWRMRLSSEVEACVTGLEEGPVRIRGDAADTFFVTGDADVLAVTRAALAALEADAGSKIRPAPPLRQTEPSGGRS